MVPTPAIVGSGKFFLTGATAAQVRKLRLLTRVPAEQVRKLCWLTRVPAEQVRKLCWLTHAAAVIAHRRADRAYSSCQGIAFNSVSTVSASAARGDPKNLAQRSTVRAGAGRLTVDRLGTQPRKSYEIIENKKLVGSL